MSDLISISEASRKLGINRSVLNRHINTSEIKKTRSGRTVLVSYSAVCDLVQTLSGTGHFKVATRKKLEKETDDLIKILKDELKTVREERDQLHRDNRKLLAENGELKLLRAGSPEKKPHKSLKNVLKDRVNRVIDFIPDL